jgi:hypothetical protein
MNDCPKYGGSSFSNVKVYSVVFCSIRFFEEILANASASCRAERAFVCHSGIDSRS